MGGIRCAQPTDGLDYEGLDGLDCVRKYKIRRILKLVFPLDRAGPVQSINV